MHCSENLYRNRFHRILDLPFLNTSCTIDDFQWIGISHLENQRLNGFELHLKSSTYLNKLINVIEVYKQNSNHLYCNYLYTVQYCVRRYAKAIQQFIPCVLVKYTPSVGNEERIYCKRLLLYVVQPTGGVRLITVKEIFCYYS